MFQDHAVLQRDRPIRIYGDTTPRTDVTVNLGVARITARAGNDGRWNATLPAMTAGGPYTLTASANSPTWPSVSGRPRARPTMRARPPTPGSGS
jgi:sialate O-acetylesterase